MQNLFSTVIGKKYLFIKIRWVCLTAYCMAQVAMGIGLVTVNTIVRTVVNIYDIDEVYVYIGMYANQFFFIPGNLLSVKIIDKWGLKPCVTQ